MNLYFYKAKTARFVAQLLFLTLYNRVGAVPPSGFLPYKEVVTGGSFSLSQPHLILHRCHVISLFSPVDRIRARAVCFDVTAFGGRAVLQRQQQWKSPKKRESTKWLLLSLFSCLCDFTCGSDQRKCFLNSAKVMSENWFSPTVAGN